MTFSTYPESRNTSSSSPDIDDPDDVNRTASVSQGSQRAATIDSSTSPNQATEAARPDVKVLRGLRLTIKHPLDGDAREASQELDAFRSEFDLPRPTHLAGSEVELQAHWLFAEDTFRLSLASYAEMLGMLAVARGFVSAVTTASEIASLTATPRPEFILLSSKALADGASFLQSIAAAHGRLRPVNVEDAHASPPISDLPAPVGAISNALVLLPAIAAETAEAPTDTFSPLERARQVLENLLMRVKAGDVGAPLEPANTAALSELRLHDEGAYFRFRTDLKSADKRIPLVAIDKAVRKQTATIEVAQTHHGYAADILKRLAVGNFEPVGVEGDLYVVDPDRSIWIAKDTGQLVTIVATAHDGKDNCKRVSDYCGIAQHTKSLASRPSFFKEAPVGLACPGGFYKIVGSKTVVEPLTPEHRQRVLIDVTPQEQPIPLFDSFLHETFRSDQPGEEIQQTLLLQEIAGAIALGLMPRFHKAVLFFEPFGRAGKGTLEKILRRLVPNEFVTAVSPFKWSEDYFVVTLAGARLNVVGELPENDSIPSAAFKSVIGGDLITGRNPSHRPITFRNEAAHLFTSNHLVYSRDQSDAFFSRWLIISFPNSRLRSGLPLVPDLDCKIADSEMAGIARWALEGATRLLSNQRFSASSAHDKLMQKWRRGNNTLLEFMHEMCELGPTYTARRSDIYTHYVEWCRDNGSKPFSKSKVRELLQNNVTLKITHTTFNGIEIFRGVRMKPSTDPSTDFDVDLQTPTGF